MPICIDMQRGGSVADTNYVTEKACVHPSMLVIHDIDRERVIPEYLYIWLTNNGDKVFAKCVHGNAETRRITKNTLEILNNEIEHHNMIICDTKAVLCKLTK